MGQDVMTMQQGQKQQIIRDLHKAADKQGVYKTSAKELMEQSHAYENDMVAVHDKLTFLGKHELDHAYGLQSAASIEGYLLPDQQQLRKDAEKEESYGKKKSKQEKAAIKRGEYADYRVDRKSAAVNAISMYREYQEHPEHAPQVKLIVGDEFEQKPEETEEDISAKMCDIMRSRDALRAQIEGFGDKPADQMDQILVKHLKEVLECTEDAINTWQKANGVDGEGNDIPEKEIAKARHHLPLALEKYRFESVHYKRKFGQDLLKSVKKTDEWKQLQDELTEGARQLDDQENVQRVHGIQGTDQEDIDSVQRAITSHPEEYKAHKKEIDKAFGVLSSRLRRINQTTLDVRIGKNYAAFHVGNSYEDPKRKRFLMGVSAAEQQNDYMVRVMKYQAESTAAYIKFLLTGRKTDPLHAEYIRRTWGVEAESEIEGSLGELKQVKAVFATAIRMEKDKTHPDQKKLDKLERCEDNAISMRETLDEVSSVSMARKELQDVICTRYTTATGFRDIVRALTPLGQAPDMTEEYLLRQGNNLSLVSFGKTLDGEDKKEDQASLLGAMRELMPSYFKQVSVMQDLMDEVGILAKRDPLSLFKNGDMLPGYYKKAQGIRDALSRMFNSPVYDLLTEQEQARLKSEYINISAMTSASKNLFITQKEFCKKTYREYNETPPDDDTMTDCTYEKQRETITRDVERTRGADYQRSFGTR